MEVNINKSKVKGLWGCVEHSNNYDQNSYVESGAVFSWPQRSYTCSFCKREFRSAQALGGHMNVHRRDRARLRHYSPPRDVQVQTENPNFHNFDTNPNNLSSSISRLSSPSRKFPHPPFTSRLMPPLLAAPQLSTLSLAQKDPNFGKNIRATKRLFELEKLGINVNQKDGSAMKKKAEKVRLELEIGLVGQEQDDLDLELRLGYA